MFLPFWGFDCLTVCLQLPAQFFFAVVYVTHGFLVFVCQGSSSCRDFCTYFCVLCLLYFSSRPVSVVFTVFPEFMLCTAPLSLFARVTFLWVFSTTVMFVVFSNWCPLFSLFFPFFRSLRFARLPYLYLPVCLFL